jgi:hypothetical protein
LLSKLAVKAVVAQIWRKQVVLMLQRYLRRFSLYSLG